MKIGLFTDSYLPQLDGVATTVASLAQELKNRGHTVYIVAPRYPGTRQERNVFRLRSLKVYKEPEFRFALQLPEKSLISAVKIDFDLIHGHAGGPVTFLGWQMARIKNIPYIATYHTLWSKYHHYFFKGKVITPKMLEVTSRLFCNICDCIVAPTERVKKELVKYGVKKSVHVIPNGVDLAKFSSVNNGYLHEKLTIPKTKKIFLYVGRLGKEKSVDLLIRSFALVAKKEEVVLVLVGTGPETTRLKKLVKKLSIEKDVYFAGAVSREEIQKTYADADIFLFASRTETQGMVVLEALASGVPVIAVNDAAFQKVIVEGENGFLVPSEPAAFAEKMQTLLSSEQLRKTMSRKANESAAQYSLQKTVEALEDIYETVIAIHKKKPRGFKEKLSNVNDLLRSLKKKYVAYLQ